MTTKTTKTPLQVAIDGEVMRRLAAAADEVALFPDSVVKAIEIVRDLAEMDPAEFPYPLMQDLIARARRNMEGQA